MKWSCLRLSRKIFFGSWYARVSETSHHRCVTVVFVEFEWKYQGFWNIKTGEWDLKLLLLNYWNDPLLGSVETYFLELGAHVSLKRTTTLSLFLKYKNGRVEPKNFIV